MTGDGIRGREFPLRMRGYEPWPVKDLLRLLEAGFPPAIFTPRPTFARVMRGYDPAAVDRFMDTLPGDSTQERSPLGPTNPWQVAYGEAEPQDRPDPQAWLRVSDFPGTRLRISGWPSSKILGSYGDVLMTRRRITTLTLGASGQVLRIDGHQKQIVDAGTSDPILRWIGRVRRHQARAVVLQPGQRWLRFSVQGTRFRNAVMTALDESDTEVLWLRQMERNVMEAVVSPTCNLTAEILCLIELAASWLHAYYNGDDSW